MGPGRPKGPQTSQNLLVLSLATVFHPYRRNLCKTRTHPYYVIISYVIIRSSRALLVWTTMLMARNAYAHKGLEFPKIINHNYHTLLSSIGCPSCNASLWSHPTPCIEESMSDNHFPHIESLWSLPTSVQRRVDTPKYAECNCGRARFHAWRGVRQSDCHTR